jgi:hypothetical protein
VSEFEDERATEARKLSKFVVGISNALTDHKIQPV